jgi:hypothetical protein
MAHTYSAENIDRLRAEVSSDLDRVGALLARGRRTRSDAFFDLKEHLSSRLWRLGSIMHCLYEWREPDDATADSEDLEDPGDERLTSEVRSTLRGHRNGRRKPGSWGWRDDEDEMLAGALSPVLVTVPAGLVGDLRAGLLHELTAPARGVLGVASRGDREAQPEQYHEHLDYLDELRALLDLVGWAAPREQTAVVIDLRRHGRAVLSALEFAVRAIGEIERAAPSRHHPAVKRADALRKFVASVADLAVALDDEGVLKEEQR